VRLFLACAHWNHLQVPAPQEWDIGTDAQEEYAHVNLRIDHIEITSKANGILGASSRLKYDESGKKIMKGYDKNGLGILEMSVGDYEVPELLAPFPLYE